jgi:hypothetical protein
MQNWMSWIRVSAAAALLPVMFTQQAMAWGADGHRIINQLAVASLPASVPAFLRDANAQEVIRYLGPEPDRWRGQEEAELSAAQAPDHFIDLEYARLVGVLPKRRYEFIRELEKAQAAHPDLPLAADKVGMQPWQVEEVWQRLEAGLRDYRQLVAAHQDTRGAETAVLCYAGWLGHYVGDGSQPLHTTIQFNGWTGPNPHGYTTEHHIHAQFETDFVTANISTGDVAGRVAAARPKVIGEEWAQYLEYLGESNRLVEETYRLEKAGGFRGAGSAEAKEFTEQRLAAGAIELRDLIYTAWVRSEEPEHREGR